MPVCLVCGDINAQHHYGTVCCPSCKGFFRRVFISSKSLECYRGNCCNITKETRNACRACRYKKCLAVGMNVQEIRGRAESPVMLPEIDEEPGTSETKISPIGFVDEAEQLASRYLNLEKFCEAATVGDTIEEGSLIERMLDGTVRDLVARSTPQCPRFPRCWKPREFVDEKNFRRSWARDVVNMLDWTSHFPAFKRLSDDDRAKVFVSRFTQFALLTKCFRTYKEGCSGLVFGCGNVFPYESEAQAHVKDPNLRQMLARVTSTLFADVIFPMSYLSLTEGEYVLMKANILLHEGFSFNSLSEAGKAAISMERLRHREALLSMLMAKHDQFEDTLNQVILAENIAHTIETAASYMDKEIQYMHVFGFAGLDRPLIRDCHVDKYAFSLNSS